MALAPMSVGCDHDVRVVVRQLGRRHVLRASGGGRHLLAGMSRQSADAALSAQDPGRSTAGCATSLAKARRRIATEVVIGLSG